MATRRADHDHGGHAHDSHVHGTHTGTMGGRPKEPKKGRRGVSPTFKGFVEAHDWKGKTAVDIGCGTGAATVLVANLGADALGIDVDAEVLIAASERAKEEKATSARFMCADVEMADYADLAGARGGVDGVLAHLCFSEEIAKRAATALKPGGRFFVRSFESEMWKESGPASDFAFTTAEMRKLLAKTGFKVSRLEVERRVQTFDTFAEFEKSMLWDPHRRADWEESGRLRRLKASFAKGNHGLTEAFLVVEAERVASAPRKTGHERPTKRGAGRKR